MAELHTLSATTLKKMLDDGEVSSVEIVQALHARADEVEPRVGAFSHQLRRESLAAAEASDAERAKGDATGMLHGLPMTVKENIDTEGLASTLGMRSRENLPAPQDAVTVRVAKAEGALVLGKTNVPQSLLAPMETTNAIFGTTHNPWRHGHGPGGSSGGEGAAIASGTSLFGIGTDIGGSIRTPAAFCGIVGIKPTRNRWSNVGSNGVLAGQELVQSQVGPMARTTDDLILLMEALRSPAQAALDPAVPPLPLGDVRDIDATKLTVGFFEDDGWLTPAASVRRGVREAVRLLEDAGARVVRFEPQHVEEILFLYFRGLTADGTETLFEALDGESFIQPLRTLARMARMPKQARTGLAKALRLMGENRVPQLLEAMGEKRVKDFWSMAARRTALRREELGEWDRKGIDVLLCPSYATPAAPQGMSHDFTIGFVDLARFNLLDMPAGVVPITRVRPDEIHRSGIRDRVDKRAAQIEAESTGLPVGVQVVGRPWREDQVLATMRFLEERAREGEAFPVTPLDPR
ncbi:MAG: amidase [Sandaracinus sp.]|nr:amidase [Sandaracinus sp.]